MERIQFYDRTERRNLKFRINCMVKQKMDQREAELFKRRRSLRELLAFENLQYNEELAVFLRHKVESNARKRDECIRTMRLEKERAEEELRQLKELQRELENCQEIRRLQSQELLLDTKQAQLHQIEEKKCWRRREKEIEEMWVEISKRLDEEREKHEVFERKLRKIIADETQRKNAQQFEEMRARYAIQQKELQEELQLDNERALSIDRECREQQRIHERRKKLRQSDILKQQMQENLKILKLQEEWERDEEKKWHENEEAALKENMEQKEREKISNRLWHQNYLQHCQDERSDRRERDRRWDALLVGRECVLYEQNKKPYGKNVR